MKLALLFVIVCVSAVLYNAGPVPIPSPWATFQLPDTAAACIQANGRWMPAVEIALPYNVEADKPARCQIEYDDQGVSCKTPESCKSHICIVHPIKHTGTCLGMLPPRGRFDFFDSHSNVRSAKLPL
jgi:hypothetical protein